MKKKTQKPKYLVCCKTTGFIWSKRDKIIEKVAALNAVDILEKRNVSKFSIFKVYKYVVKSDKKELLHNFLTALVDDHGYRVYACVTCCPDMTNSDVAKYAKYLIKKQKDYLWKTM